jgi:hypothetical protein
MPEQLSPKAWRRRLRISVRGLIVLVLIIGAELGWIVQGARIQREAVAAIRRDGGVVSSARPDDVEEGCQGEPAAHMGRVIIEQAEWECPDCRDSFVVVRGSAYDGSRPFAMYLIALHGHSHEGRFWANRRRIG